MNYFQRLIITLARAGLLLIGSMLLLSLSACGGGGGGSATTTEPPVVVPAINSVPVVLDNGPPNANSVINVPYTTVTICRPGTSVCQTIDHVLIDTGSYGLRVMKSVLSNNLALPAVTTLSGDEVGECAQFVSGFAWGSVKSADIKIGGEMASSLSIQIMSDTAPNFSNIPSSCHGVGANLGSVSAFAANAVLGVGLFKEDCGLACAQSALTAAYYACNNGNCTSSALPLAKQVSNPVASFATNNNGLVFILPAVANGGVVSLSGTLIFGVDTASNNTISTQTVYATDSIGNFTTIYKGASYTSSFLDTGSNGIFFNDAAITSCASSVGFYCPSPARDFVAVNASYDGSSSGQVNFRVENADQIFGNIVAISLGGQNGVGNSDSFDWGLPFYFGRRVYLVMDGETSRHGAGPFWAY